MAGSLHRCVARLLFTPPIRLPFVLNSRLRKPNSTLLVAVYRTRKALTIMLISSISDVDWSCGQWVENRSRFRSSKSTCGWRSCQDGPPHTWDSMCITTFSDCNQSRLSGHTPDVIRHFYVLKFRCTNVKRSWHYRIDMLLDSQCVKEAHSFSVCSCCQGWLEAEAVEVKVKGSEFAGRTMMLGAIQKWNGSRRTS